MKTALTGFQGSFNYIVLSLGTLLGIPVQLVIMGEFKSILTERENNSFSLCDCF